MQNVSIYQKTSQPKYIFSNKDKTYVIVVTMESVVNDGLPIDPDNGDELTFEGMTDFDIPLGKIETSVNLVYT